MYLQSELPITMVLESSYNKQFKSDAQPKSGLFSKSHRFSER